MLCPNGWRIEWRTSMDDSTGVISEVIFYSLAPTVPKYRFQVIEIVCHVCACQLIASSILCKGSYSPNGFFCISSFVQEPRDVIITSWLSFESWVPYHVTCFKFICHIIYNRILNWGPRAIKVVLWRHGDVIFYYVMDNDVIVMTSSNWVYGVSSYQLNRLGQENDLYRGIRHECNFFHRHLYDSLMWLISRENVAVIIETSLPVEKLENTLKTFSTILLLLATTGSCL